MPYDPSTSAGRVRLLISDVDDAQVFTDEEIAAFLDLGGDQVLRAAAFAAETLAGNETLLLKYIRSRGLELDGPAVGRELRQLAKQWREASTEDAGDDTFYIASVDDGWTWR